MPANLPIFPGLTLVGAGGGIRTEQGILLPPGPRVTYVRSTGAQSGDPQDITQRLCTTLAAALSECRSGMGDIVFVLPGHTETVTDATMLTNLVAGTRIVGLGDINRDDAPTFTWGAAAASWAITVKNVYITGLRLLMDNFLNVAAPINITAPGCSLVSNYMRWSQSAALLCTTAITVGSTATDTFIGYNDIFGAPLGICTNGIILLGATVPSRTKIVGNNICAAAVSATGLINVSVAALGILIADNVMFNLAATSIAAISFANVAITGNCVRNLITVLSTGGVSVGVTGITVGGTGNLCGYHQNFVVNDPNKSGFLAPAADT